MNKIYSKDEAAKMIGIHPDTFSHLIYKGVLFEPTDECDHCGKEGYSRLDLGNLYERLLTACPGPVPR